MLYRLIAEEQFLSSAKQCNVLQLHFYITIDYIEIDEHTRRG
nr:MAG TPA: hypothetical protein [Bacteriophage sp.]